MGKQQNFDFFFRAFLGFLSATDAPLLHPGILLFFTFCTLHWLTFVFNMVEGGGGGLLFHHQPSETIHRNWGRNAHGTPGCQKVHQYFASILSKVFLLLFATVTFLPAKMTNEKVGLFTIAKACILRGCGWWGGHCHQLLSLWGEHA